MAFVICKSFWIKNPSFFGQKFFNPFTAKAQHIAPIRMLIIYRTLQQCQGEIAYILKLPGFDAKMVVPEKVGFLATSRLWQVAGHFFASKTVFKQLSKAEK